LTHGSLTSRGSLICHSQRSTTTDGAPARNERQRDRKGRGAVTHR
jgi:hypothetical protein